MFLEDLSDPEDLSDEDLSDEDLSDPDDLSVREPLLLSESKS